MSIKKPISRSGHGPFFSFRKKQKTGLPLDIKIFNETVQMQSIPNLNIGF
jgi:hypothetical protein